MNRILCILKGHKPYRPWNEKDNPLLFVEQPKVEYDRTVGKERLVAVDVCARCGALYAVKGEV